MDYEFNEPLQGANGNGPLGMVFQSTWFFLLLQKIDVRAIKIQQDSVKVFLVAR